MIANILVPIILLLASVNSAVAVPIVGRQVDFASDLHGLVEVGFMTQAPVNKRQDASSGQDAGSQDAFANLGGIAGAESVMEQIMSNLPSTLVPSASQLFADITATITPAPTAIVGGPGESSTEASSSSTIDSSSSLPTGSLDASSTDSAAAVGSSSALSDGSSGSATPSAPDGSGAASTTSDATATTATSGASDGPAGSAPTGISSGDPAGATATASSSENGNAMCGVPSSGPSGVSAPTDSPAGASATDSASASSGTASSDSATSDPASGTAAVPSGTDATDPAGPTGGSSSADVSTSTNVPNGGAAPSGTTSAGDSGLPTQTSSADASSNPTATGADASPATATATDTSVTSATDSSAPTATSGAGDDALSQDLQKANQDVNNVVASLMSMLPESAQAQASEMVAAATQAIGSDFSQIKQAAQSGSLASPTASGMVTIAARHTSPTLVTFLPRTNGAFSTHLTMSKTTLTGFIVLLGSVLVGSLTI